MSQFDIFSMVARNDPGLEGNSRIWVYAQVRGITIGSVEVSIENNDFAWICNIYVDPEYRRKGVAKALINRAISIAHTFPQVLGMAGSIKDSNKVSQKLAASLGFIYVYQWVEKEKRGPRLYCTRIR